MSITSIDNCSHQLPAPLPCIFIFLYGIYHFWTYCTKIIHTFTYSSSSPTWMKFPVRTGKLFCLLMYFCPKTVSLTEQMLGKYLLHWRSLSFFTIMNTCVVSIFLGNVLQQHLLIYFMVLKVQLLSQVMWTTLNAFTIYCQIVFQKAFSSFFEKINNYVERRRGETIIATSLSSSVFLVFSTLSQLSC